MLGITHLAIGASFGVFVAKSSGQPPTLLEWAALLVGSLAPDLDQGQALIARPGSLLSRFLPRGPRVLLDVLGLAASRLLRSLFGHRELVHWPLLAMSFIGGGILFQCSPLAWFGWGYVLHILADSCTRGGVPLLAPFSRKRICFLTLRTGSWPEYGLAVGLWIYVINAGYGLLPPITRHWLGRYAALVTHGAADQFRPERY